MYGIKRFFVLIYPKNSNIEPNPCIANANGNMLKLYACKDAKNTITIIIDVITENLRLFEYLNNIRKKNMNGMNLNNSSPISENISGGISINEGFSIRVLPIIPKGSRSVDITSAYNMYPTNSAKAKAMSLAFGF